MSKFLTVVLDRIKQVRAIGPQEQKQEGLRRDAPKQKITAPKIRVTGHDDDGDWYGTVDGVNRIAYAKSEGMTSLRCEVVKMSDLEAAQAIDALNAENYDSTVLSAMDTFALRVRAWGKIMETEGGKVEEVTSPKPRASGSVRVAPSFIPTSWQVKQQQRLKVAKQVDAPFYGAYTVESLVEVTSIKKSVADKASTALALQELGFYRPSMQELGAVKIGSHWRPLTIAEIGKMNTVCKDALGEKVADYVKVTGNRDLLRAAITRARLEVNEMRATLERGDSITASAPAAEEVTTTEGGEVEEAEATEYSLAANFQPALTQAISRVGIEAVIEYVAAQQVATATVAS